MTGTAQRKPGRRGRPGYDLEQVLEVAAHLFYERGYDGTSMEELSKRLGLTKAAIYHHVAGKEELLRLIVDRALDGLFAVADEVQAADGPAVGRLERLVRGSVHVLSDRLPYVTVLLRVPGTPPSSEPRSTGAASSTAALRTWYGRRRQTATSGRTSTRARRRACCSAWSTR